MYILIFLLLVCWFVGVCTSWEKLKILFCLIHAFFLNIIKRIGGVTTFATPRVVYLQQNCRIAPKREWVWK